MFVAWTLVTLIKSTFFSGPWFGGDYAENLAHSNAVVRGGTYPFGFSYPLPSVLLRYYLGFLGPYAGGLIWIAGIALSLLYVVRYLTRELYTGPRDWQNAWAVLSVLLVVHYVQWDLRALNCNLITLACVCLSLSYSRCGRWFPAGLFLAFGIALKLYPVVIVPYFLARRRFRLVGSAALLSVILFAIVPALFLGVPAAYDLTLKWISNIAMTGADNFLINYGAYQTSAQHVALSWLSGGRPFELSAAELHAVQRVFRGLQAGMVVLGAVYLLFDASTRWLPARINRDLFNAALFLLVALPLSAQLQPAHGVVLLASSMCITNFVLFGGVGWGARGLVAAVASISAIALVRASPGIEKAVTMNVQIVTHAIVLVFLRFYRGHADPRSTA